LQAQLNENIKYTNLAIKKHGLPLVSESATPIFFIGVSLPKIGYSIISRMLKDGYYVNAGIFPGVPVKNTGIRFTITKLHTFKEIDNMLEALTYHHAEVLKEENFPISKVYQAFKMKEPIEQKMEEIITIGEKQSKLQVQHVTSVIDVDKLEWDNLLGNRGTYNWDGLKLLEESFSANLKPEENWNFDYIIVRDENEKPVLVTFLTSAIWKDDMLAPEGVSVQVENKRKSLNDPYYLTSKLVSMGSLLTEGDHLYIDRTSPYWKEAMGILLEKMSVLQEKYRATGTLLRDLKQGDDEMDNYMMDNGYFKMGMPVSHVIDTFNWTNREEFVATLSSRSRRHVRRDVMDYVDKYEVTIAENLTAGEIEHLYGLYMNVKAKSLLLNTFALPYKLFENMAADPNWEIMLLNLKPEFDKREKRKPIAAVFSYVTEEKYNPMIVGLDYAFQEEFKCYKQALYRVIERTHLLRKKAVNLGFGATVEKQKYGAKLINVVAYMQAQDNFSLEVVSGMNVAEVVSV